MRKLAKTFVRTGTFRVIDICSKPKVSSGVRYGIRVEDDGHIGVYVGTNDTIGWDEIHLNKITVPEEQGEKCDRCGKVDDDSETYYIANNPEELICKSCVEDQS